MIKIFKKIAILLVLLCPLFLFTGCSKKAFVVFSEFDPKNGLNKEQLSSTFSTGQKVHFVVIAPEGFEEEAIRVVLTKKDAKSEFRGYSNRKNKVFETAGIDYVTDYYILNEAGIYIVQVFDLINLSDPVATGTFRVY